MSGRGSLGLLAIVAALLSACIAVHGQNSARVEFSNEADVDVDVFWRNDAEATYHLLTTIQKGLKGALNTFRGHQFLVIPQGTSLPSGAVKPNYVQSRMEQDMVIKKGDSDLVVLESEDGRRRLGLPPRRPNNATVAAGRPIKSQLLVQNDADVGVSIYWRNDGAHDYIRLIPLLSPGEDIMINTFRGHALLVVDASVAVSYDSNPANHEQSAEFQSVRVVRRSSGLALLPADESSDVELNTENVKEVIRKCSKQPACIASVLFKSKLARLQKELQAEMDTREEIEEKYRDWACTHQVDMLPANTTTHTWVWDPDNEGPDAPSEGSRRREISVEKLFESHRQDARIMVLSNFASEAECQALKIRAEPRLQAAAVTGDAPGEKIISKSRKAKSSMVKPNHSDPGDVLGDLRNRVFAFVNAHSPGMEAFELPGQEPFNVIKYNISGDEYKLHCDGYCDSSKYISGGRAATVVVYCEDAPRGGQTSFTNADIVVKGKPGQAAFFHYIDRNGYMDNGWTKHSGCPVFEGTKWIATQWIRYGVSEQDPWYLYTPTGDRDFSDPSPRDM